MKEEMQQINIRYSKQKWELFKKIAEKNNRDASKEVRKILDDHIEANKDKLNSLF